MADLTVVIFTDGGITPAGVGGAGAVICSASPGLGHRELKRVNAQFPAPTTSQRMELSAAILGLESFVAEWDAEAVDIEIHSDSAYVVNCFKDGWYAKWIANGWKNSAGKPVENADLWRRLLGMTKGPFERMRNVLGPRPWEAPGVGQEDAAMLQSSMGSPRVTFHKVKGHSGHPLNELADQLATKGKNGEIV